MDRGYLKDDKSTKEAIDAEGFLHSGDIGMVDDHGMVWITGRLKELLIGAGGENIAPVPVEEAIKKEMSAVSNCMMVGDRKKFNTVLICLHTRVDEKSGEPTNELAGAALKIGSKASTIEEAKKCSVWKSYLEKGIERANRLVLFNV